MAIRCVLFDDHLVVSEALRMMLEAEDGIQVVGECASAQTLLDIADRHDPDIILVDLEIPGCDPVESALAAKERTSACKLVALTAYPSDANIARAMSRGFVGFLTKSEPAEFIIEAVRGAARGERVFSEFVRSRSVNAQDDHIIETKSSRLTRREIEIVLFAAQGLTTQQIASQVSRSPRTIENQLHSAMKKVGVQSRVELVKWAIREGLATP